MEFPLLSPPPVFFFFLTLFFSSSFHPLHAQQTYINNKQDDCTNNASETLGYACNGPQASCNTYLFFRSTPFYDSALTIAYLLGADSKMIAQFNSITDIEKIPNNTQVIVPVSCSCSGGFYQHNASYTLKSGEGYYIVSYDRYQGLTTCQAMINQNSQDASSLEPGMNLRVPL